jgi:hypothetical protein
MWFWRIYVGLAAVGVVLILLGGAGARLLRVSARSSAVEDQPTRTGARHRRAVKPRPTVVPRSAPRLDAVLGRTLRRARRPSPARGTGTLMPTGHADVAQEQAPRTSVAGAAGAAGAAEVVDAVQVVGPVTSGVLRCSGFAISLGTALVVSSTCVIVFVLSVEALYWGGERLFGQDWVDFLDGLLG